MSTRTDDKISPRSLSQFNHLNESSRSMAYTLNSLMDSDRDFGTSNHQLVDLSSVVQKNSREVGELRCDLLQHEKKDMAEIRLAQKIIQEDLKTRIGEHLRDYIRDSIKTEVAIQVEQEVDIQVRNHIPISLTLQVVDSKKRVADMRVALANSEARAKNAGIHTMNQDEPLAPIVKADGTRSEIFPADMRTLRSYDLELVGALVREYGLPEDATAEVNLNRFMKHIGIIDGREEE